ncbi:MAG TPA: zinc ribbon domain-containing protein [Thermoanaerobaculia bacterium]|jgi:hypothetical protein
MANVLCAACRRSIDAAAKICPYCGADPATGERMDTQAVLQEIFRPKEMTTSESVMEYARQRQGVVVGVSLLVAFLVLAGLHQFVTVRNDRTVSGGTAVPLTELADLNRVDETRPQPMPELDFQYDGKPQVMRTFIAEQGAVTPPEIVAAQQAAAQEEAMKKAAAAAAQQPAVPQPGVARPGVAPAGVAPGTARPAVPQPGLPQRQQPQPVRPPAATPR